MDTSDQARRLLRHAVATLAYRGGKAIAGEAAQAAQYHAGESARTPAQILAHIGDLMDWALSLAEGEERWHEAEPLAWPDEVARFQAAVGKFDACLASGKPLATSEEKLFQGPIADALTHVGQINLLRRLAEVPVRGENYSRARIEAGKLSFDQAEDWVEFD
jgi:hypothetical protein